MKVNMKRISLFFRRLLHRSIEKAEATHEREKPKEEWTYKRDKETGVKILESEKDPEALNKIKAIADELFPPRPRRTIVVKAGRQATRQDVSKFMKHGKQAPWYRKSVKAKIKPEDN